MEEELSEFDKLKKEVLELRESVIPFTETEYLTKNKIETGYVNNETINNYALISDVKSTYITKTEADKEHDDIWGAINKKSDASTLENYVLKSNIDFTLPNTVSDLTGRVGDLDSRLTNTYYTKENIDDLNKNFLTETNLSGLASETWVENQNYATKEELLDGYIKKGTITIPQKTSDLTNDSGYITIDNVQNFLNENNYIKSSSLDSYAKKTDLTELNTQIIDLSNNISQLNIPNLNGYATEAFVQTQGYLTNDVALSIYAQKSSIKTKVSEMDDVADYVTKSYLDGLNFVSSDYLSNNYVTKQGLNDKKYITYSEADSKYLTPTSSVLSKYALNTQLTDIRSEIEKTISNKLSNYTNSSDMSDKYLTKNDARVRYLTIEDYRGLKNFATFNTSYNNNEELFRMELDKDENGNTELFNGIYLVNNHLYMVADGKLCDINGEKTEQSKLYWEEDTEN